MKPLFGTAFCMLLTGAAVLPTRVRAQAQDRGRFTTEARAGVGVGTFERTSAGFEAVPEPAFELTGAYRVLDMLSVYAGYSRIAFGCEAAFCADAGIRLTSSGIGVGLRLDAPWSARPWVRLGLMHHRLEIDARRENASYRGVSDRAFGIDARAGVAFHITPRFLLTPGVGYARYGADFDDRGDHEGVALLVGDVGVRVLF